MAGRSGTLCAWAVAGPLLYRYTQGESCVSAANGVVVVQSLLDAATGSLATKYEESVNAIHGRMQEQHMRDAAVRDVYDAISSAGESVWLERCWATVCGALQLDHPLNPKIADAEAAIHHLGGVAMHLTSRKRKVELQDEDAEYVHREAQTHNQSDDVFAAMYNAVLKMAWQAMTAPDRDSGVFTDASNEIYLSVHPSNLGVPLAQVAFYKPASGDSFHSAEAPNKDEYTDVKRHSAMNLPLNETLTKEDGRQLSVCSTHLLLPAMVCSAQGTNVYAKSITQLETMMTHINPYAAAGDPTDALPRDIKVLRMFPVEGERGNTNYDFIVDFDTGTGWCVGGTPTLNTDAAAAAHLFVSRL